jgi:hypothetical protein
MAETETAKFIFQLFDEKNVGGMTGLEIKELVAINTGGLRYICMFICMYLCTYVYVFICMYLCTYVYVFIFMYMYLYIYIYMHICIYIYDGFGD